jgi:hypothetical protein
MKLLAKRPDQRPQNATEFCQALEALAQAGKLDKPKAPLPQELRSTSSGLAGVLSNTPVSAELEVPITPARPEPSAAQKPAAAPEARPVPKLPQRQAGNRLGFEPPSPNDMAATFKEIPAFEDDYQNPGKRSQEIAGLREVLGLHIEEPAQGANDPFQVSDMVVNLERPGQGEGALPGQSSPVLRRVSRPIEERQHMPRLLAPSQRVNKAALVQPGQARVRLGLKRALWVTTAIAIAAGSAAVLWFMR